MAQESIFAAFDLYPSAKGAATHIQHSARALFEEMGGGLLYVLGNEQMPTQQQEPEGVEIYRFKEPIANYLRRAAAYTWHLEQRAAAEKSLKIAHFRDLWSAMALIPQAAGRYKTVFEVNALPSIELPYRYDLPQKTRTKIQEMEREALLRSDQIIVPSEIIADCLERLHGVPRAKIAKISNGADPLPEILPDLPADLGDYILYFGALQAWQGIDVLLKAMRQLSDYENLRLVICSSNRPNIAKPLRKFAEQLGIGDRVVWEFQLPKPLLQAYIRSALVSVCPLKDCERNSVQGCSPIKIFESMAAGAAIVASDLPVVREILRHDDTAQLCRADRPAELARALRFLLDLPEERKKIGGNAQREWEKSYNWEAIRRQQRAVYKDLLTQ